MRCLVINVVRTSEEAETSSTGDSAELFVRKNIFETHDDKTSVRVDKKFCCGSEV